MSTTTDGRSRPRSAGRAPGRRWGSWSGAATPAHPISSTASTASTAAAASGAPARSRPAPACAAASRSAVNPASSAAAASPARASRSASRNADSPGTRTSQVYGMASETWTPCQAWASGTYVRVPRRRVGPRASAALHSHPAASSHAVLRRHGAAAAAADRENQPGQRGQRQRQPEGRHALGGLRVVVAGRQPGQPRAAQPRRRPEQAGQLRPVQEIGAGQLGRPGERAAGPGLLGHRDQLRAGHGQRHHHAKPGRARAWPGGGQARRASRWPSP